MSDFDERADEAPEQDSATSRARPLPGPGDGVPDSNASELAPSGVTAANAPVLRPSPALIRATPELARVAVSSAWHVFSWGVGATLAGANYVARRAIDGEPATAIMTDAARDLRGAARRAIGVGDGTADGSVSSRSSRSSATDGHYGDATREDLRRRGSDLLRRSNDVRVLEDTHPAFARILTEITPDEARILRFVSVEGPQPAVDVRTRRPFGIGSALVAQNLTMVAEEAGCRDLERTGQYLTNLSRLGLIDLSREQVSNPQRYQVVEAQPYVTDALASAGRWPRTVHRSILLTAFGTEFVLTCLPIAGRVVETRALPSRDIDS